MKHIPLILILFFLSKYNIVFSSSITWNFDDEISTKLENSHRETTQQSQLNWSKNINGSSTDGTGNYYLNMNNQSPNSNISSISTSIFGNIHEIKTMKYLSMTIDIKDFELKENQEILFGFSNNKNKNKSLASVSLKVTGPQNIQIQGKATGTNATNSVNYDINFNEYYKNNFSIRNEIDFENNEYTISYRGPYDSSFTSISSGTTSLDRNPKYAFLQVRNKNLDGFIKIDRISINSGPIIPESPYCVIIAMLIIVISIPFVKRIKKLHRLPKLQLS